jgi:tetratricopeptide (TPR) repeat protein
MDLPAERPGRRLEQVEDLMKIDRFPAFRVTTLLIIALLAPSVLPAAAAQAPVSSITTFEALEAATGQARGLVQADPRNPGKAFDLARLLMMDGKLDEAEGVLKAGLSAAPKHVPSLILLGRLYRTEYRFERGLEALDRAKSIAPADADVRLLEAVLAMDRMDFSSARAVYDALVAANPRNPAAICGLAEVAYWENRYDDSLRSIERCLAVEPAFSRAYLIKSLIHRIRQENDLWAAAGRKAVECGPFEADIRANLSNILMRGEKKMEEGYVEAGIALRIDPYNHPAHNYIGNGWSPRDYKDEKIAGDPEAVARIQDHLGDADAALLARDLARAGEIFGRVLALAPRNIQALLGLGTIAYHRKNFDEAQGRFQQILALEPDYGLAHYGLAQTLLRKKDRINFRFAEIEKSFAAREAPEPPFLRDVFVNYGQLDPDLQKIIRFSVKPLRALLKAAKERGSTFYLTPFHKKQSEAPNMAAIKGTRTFDLRLWDDVKGLGGRNALSGEDWERDVKYLRFNVVAHEFAHQVHRLLPKDVQDEINALYDKAKTERKTLDFYSDANVAEYFAVGVEAYVSEEKLADQKIAYGHTRRELLERDPDLYRLIERLDRQD